MQQTIYKRVQDLQSGDKTPTYEVIRVVRDAKGNVGALCKYYDGVGMRLWTDPNAIVATLQDKVIDVKPHFTMRFDIGEAVE